MARFLPDGMMKLMIVHGVSSGNYVWSRAVRDYIHHTIAISPRISEELVARYGFEPARVSIIPHAVDAPFHPVGRSEAQGGPLRVIYAGRLADHDKGCLWIPDILAAAGDRPVTLTIAGDGSARAELEARLAGAPFAVRFTGMVGQAEIAELYRRHDVVLVPSRTEGFGLVIIEAMACGCVPLVSRIQGVTDAIVTDGVDGMLFPIGDVAAAGAALRMLADDRALLARLKAAALATVGSRYALHHCIDAYAGLIDRLGRALPPTAPAQDMARWRMARGFEPRWRSRLPAPLKIWLRTARERLR
jgi:glycosyltransferase involved in cell wall biosynthesis